MSLSREKQVEQEALTRTSSISKTVLHWNSESRWNSFSMKFKCSVKALHMYFTLPITYNRKYLPDFNQSNISPTSLGKSRWMDRWMDIRKEGRKTLKFSLLVRYKKNLHCEIPNLLLQWRLASAAIVKWDMTLRKF